MTFLPIFTDFITFYQVESFYQSHKPSHTLFRGSKVKKKLIVFHKVRSLARADIVGSFTHYRFRVIDEFWGSHTKNQLPRWFQSAIKSLFKISDLNPIYAPPPPLLYFKVIKWLSLSIKKHTKFSL